MQWLKIPYTSLSKPFALCDSNLRITLLSRPISDGLQLSTRIFLSLSIEVPLFALIDSAFLPAFDHLEVMAILPPWLLLDQLS